MVNPIPSPVNPSTLAFMKREAQQQPYRPLRYACKAGELEVIYAPPKGSDGRPDLRSVLSAGLCFKWSLTVAGQAPVPLMYEDSVLYFLDGGSFEEWQEVQRTKDDLFERVARNHA